MGLRYVGEWNWLRIVLNDAISILLTLCVSWLFRYAKQWPQYQVDSVLPHEKKKTISWSVEVCLLYEKRYVLPCVGNLL
jgi:hypothetical protein